MIGPILETSLDTVSLVSYFSLSLFEELVYGVAVLIVSSSVTIDAGVLFSPVFAPYSVALLELVDNSFEYL